MSKRKKTNVVQPFFIKIKKKIWKNEYVVQHKNNIIKKLKNVVQHKNNIRKNLKNVVEHWIFFKCWTTYKGWPQEF